MNLMKTLFSFILTGAIVGLTLATLTVPTFINWYNTPGGSTAALCNCGEVVRATTDQLIHAQLYGAAIGSIVALLIGSLYLRSRARAKKVAVTGAPTTPA